MNYKVGKHIEKAPRAVQCLLIVSEFLSQPGVPSK